MSTTFFVNSASAFDLSFMFMSELSLVYSNTVNARRLDSASSGEDEDQGDYDDAIHMSPAQ